MVDVTGPWSYRTSWLELLTIWQGARWWSTKVGVQEITDLEERQRPDRLAWKQ